MAPSCSSLLTALDTALHQASPQPPATSYPLLLTGEGAEEAPQAVVEEPYDLLGPATYVCQELEKQTERLDELHAIVAAAAREMEGMKGTVKDLTGYLRRVRTAGKRKAGGRGRRRPRVAEAEEHAAPLLFAPALAAAVNMRMSRASHRMHCQSISEGSVATTREAFSCCLCWAGDPSPQGRQGCSAGSEHDKRRGAPSGKRCQQQEESAYQRRRCRFCILTSSDRLLLLLLLCLKNTSSHRVRRTFLEDLARRRRRLISFVVAALFAQPRIILRLSHAAVLRRRRFCPFRCPSAAAA